MKKNIKKILVILFFLLIIVISLIIRIEKSDEVEIQNGSLDAEVVEEYLKDKVVPQGIYKFKSEYTGNVDNNTFYIKLKDMLNYISKISETINNKKIDKFYKDNYSEIEKHLGIEEFEEFEKLAELIISKNIQGAKFSYCKILENSYQEETFYTTFNMIFYYDNETELEFQVSLLNRKNSPKPLLKITVL